MRHLIIYIVAIMSIFSSCEQDSYDKGEGTYSNMTADFVEAHVNSEKKLDYAITDNGDSLVISTPVEVSWTKTADSTYRAILYYNKMANNTAKIMGISQMNQLRVTSRDSIKVMKTDPIGLESSWASNSKRYINFAFTLKVGTVNENSALHRITLVADSITLHKSLNTLHMTLFHDKGDIPEYYTEKYYFSLPVSIFNTVGADSVNIRVNTSSDGFKTIGYNLRE